MIFSIFITFQITSITNYLLLTFCHKNEPVRNLELETSDFVLFRVSLKILRPSARSQTLTIVVQNEVLTWVSQPSIVLTFIEHVNCGENKVLIRGDTRKPSMILRLNSTTDYRTRKFHEWSQQNGVLKFRLGEFLLFSRLFLSYRGSVQYVIQFWLVNRWRVY